MNELQYTLAMSIVFICVLHGVYATHDTLVGKQQRARMLSINLNKPRLCRNDT